MDVCEITFETNKQNSFISLIKKSEKICLKLFAVIKKVKRLVMDVFLMAFENKFQHRLNV